MPTNAFNTGKDTALVILHPLATGGRLDLPLITDWDAKPSYHDIVSHGLDGYSRTAHIPQNHALSFTADRSDPAVDAFCSAIEQAYRLNGRVPDGTVSKVSGIAKRCRRSNGQTTAMAWPTTRSCDTKAFSPLATPACTSLR